MNIRRLDMESTAAALVMLGYANGQGIDKEASRRSRATQLTPEARAAMVWLRNRQRLAPAIDTEQARAMSCLLYTSDAADE